MAIDPEEIKSIENSMVHDVDEDPKPEGWGVYMTLKFLSKTVLGAYGLMLVGMLALQAALRGGESLPVSLSPESLLFALPIALVAIYLFFTADPELEIAKKRTKLGCVTTLIVVFIVMQVVSVLLWVAIAKSFSLH
jgi:hypothetical protein